jgi:hypothetical protein
MDADVHVSNLCFAVGNRIPASQVQEQQLVAYKKMELQKISDILDQHLLLCAQQKVLFASVTSQNAKQNYAICRNMTN